MGILPKQNGHPVPSKDIGFSDQEKPYTKEACDVRPHYSTLFPLSSNQNYQPGHHTRSRSSAYSNATQQAICSDLPWMRPAGHWCSQLDPAQDARSEHGTCSDLDYMPISKSDLCTMSGHPCRRLRAFSSISSGNPANGAICIRAMSVYDHIGGRPAFRIELENSQIHRQIFSGTRVRATRINWAANSCRGRDLHPQGASISNHRTGLSQRPRRLCWQRSQGQNTRTLFRSTECRATQ